MRPFIDVIRDIRKGRLDVALSEKLAEVVKAAVDHNKTGTLTLSLKIKPNGRGDNAVILTPEISAKIPQADLPDALFYADVEGDLLREDPTQQRMFAEVRHDAETGEILTAANKTA